MNRIVRIGVILHVVVILLTLHSSAWSQTLEEIGEAACRFYDRVESDRDSGACPTDACDRNVIKPQRLCEWRIPNVIAHCAVGNERQARVQLEQAYRPARNLIDQMLTHCRHGLAPCTSIASYIGYTTVGFLLQDYPACSLDQTCIRNALWNFADFHVLPTPLGDNDSDLIGAMRRTLNQPSVCN
ncbi:MAG: hypothetical protein HYZ50_06315 [Deltaproteobacteria bacterium]|nr:hypothetical protein [Deltaproteobacteria bacterium]